MRTSLVATSLLVSILATVSASPAARERFQYSVPETAAAELRRLTLLHANALFKESLSANLRLRAPPRVIALRHILSLIWLTIKLQHLLLVELHYLSSTNDRLVPQSVSLRISTPLSHRILPPAKQPAQFVTQLHHALPFQIQR